MKIQPYSILDSNYKQLFENIKTSNFNTYYNNKKVNQNKGKINLLDNLIFLNNITPENKSTLVTENKNSIKHIPEEEKLKETITNKKTIGPSTILAGTELLGNLAAIKFNNDIARNYMNSLQAPTITATQYTIPKIYQDSSRFNEFAALRNSSIPKTADINIYQNSQRDFSKQLGEYLFKEQNQQATGIRQDREKINAIQNTQLEENTKVANANEASRIALHNKLAEITMGKNQKRGEILLNTLGNIGNYFAGYKDEQQNSEKLIDETNMRQNII